MEFGIGDFLTIWLSIGLITEISTTLLSEKKRDNYKYLLPLALMGGVAVIVGWPLLIAFRIGKRRKQDEVQKDSSKVPDSSA